MTVALVAAVPVDAVTAVERGGRSTTAVRAVEAVAAGWAFG